MVVVRVSNDKAAHLCALIHYGAVTWARRGLPPPAPLLCFGEGEREKRGAKETPAKLPLPPVEVRDLKEKNPIQLWDAVDRLPTDIKLVLKRVGRVSCALGEFTHGRRRHGTDNYFLPLKTSRIQGVIWIFSSRFTWMQHRTLWEELYGRTASASIVVTWTRVEQL